MVLQLNEHGKTIYREYDGRNIDQMPKLISEGRTPLSVAELLQRRLEVYISRVSGRVREAWWNNYIDTGDGILYHPDGRVKFVRDAHPLRRLHPKSRLYKGALVLPDHLYDRTDGLELNKKEIKQFLNGSLSKTEAKKNPVWVFLSRDHKLLNEYSDSVFKQAEEEYLNRRLIFYFYENMGVSVRDHPEDELTMRFLSVRELVDGSEIRAFDDLDTREGRLVGKSPKVHNVNQQVSPTSSLDQRV